VVHPQHHYNITYNITMFSGGTRMLVPTFGRWVHRPISMALLASVFAVAACSDDSDPIPPANNPAGPGTHTVLLRLTIGGQTVDVTPTTALGAPVTLTVNTPTQVTAQWLNSDGTPDPNATTSRYELAAIPDVSAPVVFARDANNKFAGTLTATAPFAGGAVRFSLHQTASAIDDFGPYPVLFNAQ
jgi:hypothetical protein